MRYSRQDILLKTFSKNFKSSREFSNKRIVLIGCGGIGSIMADLLVRGGFSNIVLVDTDLVDETNIQRQNYYEEDIGSSKAKVLKKKLLKINSKANIVLKEKILNKNNIDDICLKSDLIVDATDNFKTRKIINEYCIKEKKDWICNGAIKNEIFCCIFHGIDNRFNKIFPKNINDESCCDVGVLSSTVHVCASISYNMILKYFMNINEKVLIKINLWTYDIFVVKI
jgi:adenylyltransferase/sulfurtransferase